MKHCTYCGRGIEDEAVWCPECGTKFAREPGPKESNPPERLERIATLDSEVQAGLVDAVLSDRGIPHLMQTYHDSAYDGIFQTQQGWGVLLAPPQFKAEVLAVVQDVKRQAAASTDRNGPDTE